MSHPWSICRASEERVAQPSQAVIDQAVQSQSPQPQAGRSQDMSQPQVWTAQTLMSLQHQTSSISSTSPAAKAMESHPVEEEAIRQRADARTHGASDSAGGARSATIAEGQSIRQCRARVRSRKWDDYRTRAAAGLDQLRRCCLCSILAIVRSLRQRKPWKAIQ